MKFHVIGDSSSSSCQYLARARGGNLVSQGTTSQRLLYTLQTVHALKLAGERSASLVPCQLMARIATLALTMRRALAPGTELRENNCRDTAADLKNNISNTPSQCLKGGSNSARYRKQNRFQMITVTPLSSVATCD